MNTIRENILRIKSDITSLRKKRDGFISNISCDEINKVIIEINEIFEEKFKRKYHQTSRDYSQVKMLSKDLQSMDLATKAIFEKFLQNLKSDYDKYLSDVLSSDDSRAFDDLVAKYEEEISKAENMEVISVNASIERPADLEKYDDFDIRGPNFFEDVIKLIALLNSQYNSLLEDCRGKSNKNIKRGKLYNSQIDLIFNNLDKLCDLLVSKIDAISERKNEILRYNNDVERYNTLVAKCISDNNSNYRFYENWINKIKKNNVFKCIECIKFHDQFIMSIKKMLKLIRNKPNADKMIVLSLENELGEVEKSYNNCKLTLKKLFGENSQYTLVEKINKIYTNDILTHVCNLIFDLRDNVSEYLDRIENEEKFSENLSFIDNCLNEQSISSGDTNISLSESQQACMRYLTEQFKNLYELCSDLFVNGNVFNPSQTDDEKYKNYIKFAGIEGSFIGVLAVFVEFISYSRFPGLQHTLQGERSFDRSDKNNNNNVEITYLKKLMPKIFKDLKFDDIYECKGFLQYKYVTEYSSEFTLSFIYNVLKNFLDGIDFLLDHSHVGFWEASRIGDPFFAYYFKRIKDMETNGIKSNLRDYRDAVMQRIYKSFVDHRNFLGVSNQWKDWCRNLPGPSWELNSSFVSYDMGDRNYQYFSAAFRLPPNISYNEINTYILKIYRMLYEIEKRFVEPLCPNEFIDNYIKELLRDESHKK